MPYGGSIIHKGSYSDMTSNISKHIQNILQQAVEVLLTKALILLWQKSFKTYNN